MFTFSTRINRLHANAVLMNNTTVSKRVLIIMAWIAMLAVC